MSHSVNIYNCTRISLKSLLIVTAILASIIGYLYYAPNSEDIAQIDRIRTVAATMKLVQLVVCFVLLILFSIIFEFDRGQQLNYLVCLIVF